MNVLFVGDIVAKPGRRVLFDNLEDIRSRHSVDLVIVNVENAAGGFGITEDLADEFRNRGVDVMTTGNHVWDKSEALEFIANSSDLIRPANYPEGTPGAGWTVTTLKDGNRVGVVNVMGAVFMHPTLDCPFRSVDAVLEEMPSDLNGIIVDFHAEATSEKVAMGWHLDGRVSAVLGTHTHIPTADERVLPAGTAFLTDAGMTGCYDSVIGMDVGRTLKRFVHKTPMRLEVARGKGTLRGAVISIDPQTGLSTHIERVTAQ